MSNTGFCGGGVIPHPESESAVSSESAAAKVFLMKITAFDKLLSGQTHKKRNSLTRIPSVIIPLRRRRKTKVRTKLCVRTVSGDTPLPHDRRRHTTPPRRRRKTKVRTKPCVRTARARVGAYMMYFTAVMMSRAVTHDMAILSTHSSAAKP